jgi:hypothetical protein
VLKAVSWHLVVVCGEIADVLRLDTLRTTRLTAQRFDPPPRFSLARFWAAHTAATHPRQPSV